MDFLILAQGVPPVAPGATQTMVPLVRWSELTLFDWHGWGLQIRVGIFWLIVIVAAVILVWWVLPLLRRKWLKNFRTRSVKLTFKGAEWEICPDTETRRIAHQAWVEIKSRKVGLPFEEGRDVIIEVYNSWLQLFGILRELAKSIPADRLEDCEDTRNVVALLMKALNEGLRPHLTQWQAKFRRWYQTQLGDETNKELSPQEIQRRYPQYDELISDLRSVSAEFVEFANSLEKIARDGG